MRTYVNGTIFNSLPSDLQNVIVSTKGISGHGSTQGETNFETQDKLYLLNSQEIWGSNDYDTSVGVSKQLDYYKNLGVTMENNSKAIKQYLESNVHWWLRSSYIKNADYFLIVGSDVSGMEIIQVHKMVFLQIPESHNYILIK